MIGSDLYFILNPITGLVKIGIATDVKHRLRSLSCANGVQLTLLATVPGYGCLEKDLHILFAEDRTTGEWFRQSVRLQRLIDNPDSVPGFVVENAPNVEAWIRREVATAAQEKAAREAAKQARLAAEREQQRRKEASQRRRERERLARENAKDAAAARDALMRVEVWQARDVGKLAELSGLAKAPVRRQRLETAAQQRTRNARMIGCKAEELRR